MTLISDILMIAGALGVAFYCVVLSRRLTRFTDLEKGMGGAIAVLSAQVDGMTRTLKAAQAEAGASGRSLEELTRRAEEVARRLELNVAALHDLPGPAEAEPDPVAEAAAPTVAFRRPASSAAGPSTSENPPDPGTGEETEMPVLSVNRPVRSFFAGNRSQAAREAAE